MRIVTNERLVKRNKSVATYLFFVSLLILITGFFIANGQLLGFDMLETLDPVLYVWIMPVVLLLGFMSTMISVRMTNLWVRRPRPEEAIQAGLKGISNKSAIYSYFHFPARHVLICPQGVFAIITRFQDGKFTVEGDRWKTHRGCVGQFFSFFRLDNIGNPTREAQEAAAYIRYIIEDYDPDLEVQPLIIFVDPRADVTIIDPTVPVLYADPKLKPNLKDYLRDLAKLPEQKGPEDLADFIEEFEAATLVPDQN
jgi:hypothetical protein